MRSLKRSDNRSTHASKKLNKLRFSFKREDEEQLSDYFSSMRISRTLYDERGVERQQYKRETLMRISELSEILSKKREAITVQHPDFSKLKSAERELLRCWNMERDLEKKGWVTNEEYIEGLLEEVNTLREKLEDYVESNEEVKIMQQELDELNVLKKVI